MTEEARQSDFERESSRLNQGLKSCRAVMDNYRSMMAIDAQSDDSDMSRYVSTTGGSASSSGAD